MISSMRRRGFSLVELIVALVVLAIFGTAATKLMIAQSRFYSQTAARRAARSVSRGAINLLYSDLRMVEVTGGVVAASSQSVTVRSPYAFGVVCGASGGGTAVSLLPTDSVLASGVGFSGYAWRDTLGNYSYVEGGASAVATSAAPCTAASVTTLTGGSTVRLSPALPADAQAGTPVFLFQRLQYSFGNSAAVPGRLGLWRTVVASGATEELVAPFDASSRFSFYVLDSDTAQSAVPGTLSNIRGLQLTLNGSSQYAGEGSTTTASAPLSAAVFFKNRLY